jgi:hypothetical protein
VHFSTRQVPVPREERGDRTDRHTIETVWSGIRKRGRARLVRMSSSVGGQVGPGWASGGNVRSSTERGNVTIALEGHLDAVTGDALLDTVRGELVHEPVRIDIDLSVLASFAADGAIALSRCRDICSKLPDGLHYRTEGGAGQLALLSAFEHEPEVDTFG